MITAGERGHRPVPIVHINRIASYHAGRQGRLAIHDEDGWMAVDEELMAVIMPACRGNSPSLDPVLTQDMHSCPPFAHSKQLY